jgi:PAS domain-containing protein
MLELLRIAGDLLGFVAFTTAFVMLAVTPADREKERFQPAVKWVMLAALGVYVLVTASDVATQFGITSAGEPVEDYVESIFPLLVLGAAFAAFSAQQTFDVARSQNALGQANDLMLGIVDAAPAGILFLSPDGRIRFANDAAKHVLDLVEHPDTASVLEPVWIVEDCEGAEPGALRPLVHERSYDGLPVALRWPSGWRIELRVSGRPLADATGEFGGVVVTFERPSLGSHPEAQSDPTVG